MGDIYVFWWTFMIMWKERYAAVKIQVDMNKEGRSLNEWK